MTNRGRKVLGGVAVSALLAGGVVGFATTSATAASSALNFSCALSDKTGVPFTAVVDTDLPATMNLGESFTPTVTSTVTVPSAVVSQLTFFGYNSGSGTAVAQASVDGEAASVPMTIPATPMPKGKPFVVTATGTSPVAVEAAEVGTIAVEAGDFTATLTFIDGVSQVATYAITCELVDGQDAVVDTVEVIDPDAGGDGDGDGSGDGDGGSGDGDGGTGDGDGDGGTGDGDGDGGTGDGDGSGDGDGGSGDSEYPHAITVPGSLRAGEDFVATVGEGDELEGEEIRFEVHSTPVSLGTKTVGAGGRVGLTLPASVPAGSHTLYAFSGSTVIAATPVTVLAADTGVLPATGGPALWILLSGLGVVAAGATAVVAARRSATIA